MRVATLLDRDFFARPAPSVARDLVGKLLVRTSGEGELDLPAPQPRQLVVRVVETEAYTQHDPASHGYGRRTMRNAPLYGPPGHAYVYRSYGIHWCLNTSTGVDGVASGVLIRAAEALEGVEVMAQRRPGVAARELLRGPAKLTIALAIDGSMTGDDLCTGGRLRCADDGSRPPVVSGPRVGVTAAADWPWRFAARGSPFVSAYRRSPRAPAPPRPGS